MSVIRKIKVFIADQQALFRQGVKFSLSQKAKDITVCGEDKVVPSPVKAVESSMPDVVLLDITSPPSAGLDLCREIKHRLPSVGVIIVTPNAADDQLVQAIKSRASAYLNRDVSDMSLIDTIRRVAAGEYPINETLTANPTVVENIMNEFQDLSWGKGIENMLYPLTQRETQVLNYMAQGCPNRQIASVLSISEQTVKNHVTSIFRKLDANARTQAVVIAVKRGLISLPGGK